MEKIKVTINGKEYSFEKRKSVWQAAKENGFEIPSFCMYKGICTDGDCGVCLAKVNGEIVKTCRLPITDGMDVRTYDAEIFEARKAALEKIIAKHDGRCLTCFKNTQCELQDLAYIYECDGEIGSDIELEARNRENKFFIYDTNRCIHCHRCIDVCSFLQGVGAISEKDGKLVFASEGARACVSCGNCLQACPVGAITPKAASYNVHNHQKTLTTCSYCGVGCQLELYSYNGKLTGVRGAKGVNHELTCVKGRFAFNFVNHPARLRTPLIRKDGVLVPCSWDEAFAAIKEAFDKAKAHGPEAMAGLSSARCTNEENYLFQKFMRTVAGTNNVDHCARLCHASTVAGLARSFGSGAMTNSINEAEKTDVFLVTGSNTTETHPVIAAGIRRALARGARLIVAEPRRIDLCRDASIFLQIRPGTNVAFLNGMMKAIVEYKAWNKEFIAEHCEGAEEFFAGLETVSVSECAEICGINEHRLREAAKLYAGVENAAIYYAMGVTQHSTGTDGVMSVANLAMLTGQIGRVGTGVNPLRGQNNVQGSCDMGALPGDLTGYQKTANAEARAKFEAAWNCELPQNVGLTSTEMIEKIEEGKIRFLYIMGENPLVSDADLNRASEAFRNPDCFKVVQDIFLTETAEIADVVLPAASFAEKLGTFTSTERKVQLVRPAISPVGASLPDWKIICELAGYLGADGFDFTSPSEIMDEIASVTPSYGGISYARLENGGLHWPCPDAEHPGTPMLHKDGNFTRGKGLLSFRPYKPAVDQVDEEYPLLLTTGRVLYQYHTATMTGKNEQIQEIAGENFVEINYSDAEQYGIDEGDIVKVSSPRGSVQAHARITARVAEGVLFMPFHYADNPANKLTAEHLDPIAKIPEFKVNKVKITKLS